MLEVLYGTGVRISELVGLDLRSLDREARLLLVMGKGSKERLVPVGRFALEALDAWCEVRSAWSGRSDRSAASAMFLNQRGGRLTRQGAWLVLRRRAELAGLGDLVHPHVLRHSCATHMLDHGADLRTVQEMLGHASLSTTQIYTKVATARLWEVYDAAHPRALVEVGA
jgi:integrase/recombinase XerD